MNEPSSYLIALPGAWDGGRMLQKRGPFSLPAPVVFSALNAPICQRCGAMLEASPEGSVTLPWVLRCPAHGVDFGTAATLRGWSPWTIGDGRALARSIPELVLNVGIAVWWGELVPEGWLRVAEAFLRHRASPGEVSMAILPSYERAREALGWMFHRGVLSGWASRTEGEP